MDACELVRIFVNKPSSVNSQHMQVIYAMSH